MKLDICLPTLRTLPEVLPQIRQMESTAGTDCRIIASCQPVSAACNRNFCLDLASTPIIVMMDDDMEGWFPGWATKLVEPLLACPEVVMVSARLMAPNGELGPSCYRNRDLSQRWVTIPPARECVMPSAAIAFRNWGIRFDPEFQGSGWEDNDFCFNYLAMDPAAQFVVNNEVKLVHRNEEKQQKGAVWQVNHAYFRKKWSIRD